MKKETIYRIFKENNISITNNRIKIIQCLNDGHHFHNINDIVEHLSRDDKKPNVKSIYNSLKILIENNIVENYALGINLYYTLNDNILNNNELIAHCINNENRVSHINLNSKILKLIKKELKNNNMRFKNLKILIKIK